MNKKLLVKSLIILYALILNACSQTIPETIMPAEPAVDTNQVNKESGSSGEQPLAETVEEAAPVSQPDWYAYDLTDINTGVVFRVEDFSGKVVLVETMAVWCSNCLRQQKEVARLHDLVGGRDDLISIGIDIDPNEDVPKLTDFVKNNGFDWRYVVASDELINDISTLYGTQYLNPPSTPMFIIDRQGTVHQLPFGVKSAESLLDALQPFLDE
jgi:thiol-disulfide isomerase/thioredoxin